MRKLILLALLTIALSASAQSVLTIDTQKCVWHPGDDPDWAAPTLDESSWRPYSEWKSDPNQRHLWVRCNFDPAALHAIEKPALQVTLFSAYQLYIDGTLVSTVGNLSTGNFSFNAIRSFLLTKPQLQPNPVTLAIRITDRNSFSMNNENRTRALTIPFRVRIGNASLLQGLRDSESNTRGRAYLISTLCYGALGISALILIVFYLYDRVRRELLLLSLTCIAIALFRWSAYASVAFMDHSLSSFLWIFYGLGQLASGVFSILFFYSVAKKRIPIAIWTLMGFLSLSQIPNLLDILLAAKQPVWLDPLRIMVGSPLYLACRIVASLTPFFAFYPFWKLPSRVRPLAIPCMLWGIADILFYALQVPSISFIHGRNLFQLWGTAFLDVRAFTTAGVLFALVFLLLREQREVSLERAILAGELLGARDIQRMLAPAHLDCAPGLQIDVAFHPMREVGGDFYLCRVLPDGRQRVLLGDVSGKGAAAAMAATLLIGAASRRDADSPAELLRHLNLVLNDCGVGGFATCICADCTQSGEITLANAGHLPPYVLGKEIDLPSGLPLGLVQPKDDYEEISLTISPDERLTLVSDGVVEARNATGELFGFDRTRAISNLSATNIAQAAQSHGQEDDITVLTITRVEKHEQTNAMAATHKLATT